MYLYLLSAEYYTLNKNGVLTQAFKIGTTKNPSKRLDSYKTSHARKVQFKYLFHLDESSFELENDLYRLDAIKLPLYLREKELNYLHCDMGGGKEWFWEFEKIDYEKLLIDFLNYYKIKFKKEEFKDEKIISTFIDFEKLKEDLQKKLKINFRFPQLRLWDHFVNLSEKENVNGVLEWMMGTGKTIGALEMISIARKREGFLKGFIVCHRKDILEQFARTAEILDLPIFRYYENFKETPEGDSYLFFISHQVLIKYEIPSINFFLYDEVHRISGPGLNDKMRNYFSNNEVKYILGLSATPIINLEHQEYIRNIYGPRINILDTCDYAEAVKLKIVAPLKFHLIYREKNIKPLDVAKNAKDDIRSFLNQNALISCPSSKDDRDDVLEFFKNNFETTNYLKKKEFEEDEVSNVKCLFSCRMYQEGTDLKNLGLAFIFAGDQIEPYIIFQISGRTTRLDYDGKEAQCVLFWTGDIGSIRSLFKFLGKNFYKRNLEEKELFENLIGSIRFPDRRTVSAEDFYKELTDPAIKFERLRSKVISRGITDLGQYNDLMKNDYDYVQDPQKDFSRYWVNEAHFFGFPPKIISLTKIIKLCDDLKIMTLKEYSKASKEGRVPLAPQLYYKDFVSSFNERLYDDL